ncbi:hypothetical protein [Thioalkalivibrio sp. HK1]|uniref:hypothetical protein n=1 Tax=Thioalkalivibrio sp. HK1 TaxID=1469245 RepID=UPI0012DE9CDC|nr:hypothetical protein [Thioalkalivibrio sp. HK1]
MEKRTGEYRLRCALTDASPIDFALYNGIATRSNARRRFKGMKLAKGGSTPSPETFDRRWRKEPPAALECIEPDNGNDRTEDES